jgi:hypothetical protein
MHAACLRLWPCASGEFQARQLKMQACSWLPRRAGRHTGQTHEVTVLETVDQKRAGTAAACICWLRPAAKMHWHGDSYRNRARERCQNQQTHGVTSTQANSLSRSHYAALLLEQHGTQGRVGTRGRGRGRAPPSPCVANTVRHHGPADHHQWVAGVGIRGSSSIDDRPACQTNNARLGTREFLPEPHDPPASGRLLLLVHAGTIIIAIVATASTTQPLACGARHACRSSNHWAEPRDLDRRRHISQSCRPAAAACARW